MPLPVRFLALVVALAFSVPVRAHEQPFPASRCVLERPIDRSLPTVVLTHGWRFKNSEFSQPPEAVLCLGRAIEQRVSADNGMAIRGGGHGVNVVYFVWPEASRPLSRGMWDFASLVRSCRNVSEPASADGRRLATELKRLLGARYAQPIQFIGHSFGAFVNAYAVHELQEHSGWSSPVQFTILDSAMSWTLVSQRGLRALLKDHGRMKVAWVDNYFGVPILAVGSRLQGAGPNWGWMGGAGVLRHHCGVIDYYAETVRQPREKDGFYYSILLGARGGWSIKRPSEWNGWSAGKRVLFLGN